MYDYDQVKELIGLVAERGLEELEIERNGFRLRIVGRSPTPTTFVTPAVSPQIQYPQPAAVAPSAGVAPAPPVAAQEETVGTEPAEDVHNLTSPIVGTFYVAPSPEAEPFVQIGDRVEPGQVLCIVEAMKLMNEIESDVAGTVLAVLEENAKAVEFGQPLFSIRTE